MQPFVRVVVSPSPSPRSLSSSLPSIGLRRPRLRRPEPSFDLVVHGDPDVRAGALRGLLATRDLSLFAVICAGAAIDEILRRRAGLAVEPVLWRGWHGLVPGPILTLPADERLAWAMEFADKLLEPQRYPADMVAMVSEIALSPQHPRAAAKSRRG